MDFDRHDYIEEQMVERTIAPATLKWINMHFIGCGEDTEFAYNKSYALNQAMRILQDNPSEYLYEIIVNDLNVYTINKLLKYSDYLKNNDTFKKYALSKILNGDD